MSAAPRAHHVRAALAAALPLALGGCTADAPRDASVPNATPGADSGCEPDGATLVLGTLADNTLWSFRRLADGDPVYLTPGSQGAQHIWVALRVRGVDPALARIEMTAYRAADGTPVGTSRVRLPLSVPPEDPNQFGLPAQPLVLDTDRYCSVLPGDVRIVLTLDDLHGHCAGQAVTVRLAGLDPLAGAAARAAIEGCCTEHRPRCYPDAGGADSGGGAR